ncbi:MAG: nitroreductase family protein [Planctomycetota bacterium]
MEELVRRNRSYRRFHPEVRVGRKTLEELVDLARLTASAKNGQSLRYFLSCTDRLNDVIFPHLFWAGYLKDWDGPEEGERPAAYIVVLQDTRIEKEPVIDAGIAAQTILLGAVERELGGCIIGSISRRELAVHLGFAPHLEIRIVVALGKPKETVVLEPMGPEGDVKYWRDAEAVHHVPKRSLREILLN